MAKSKDLTKRTQLDKFLRDKGFKIVSHPKYNGYQRRLASMVYKFLINSLGRSVDAQPNYELANELHKQIIRKCKRPRDSSSLRDTILGVD